MSEKPLTPWIIGGRILAGHCDCTAGLVETCSHVASLLWIIGVGVETRVADCDTEKRILDLTSRSTPVKYISFMQFNPRG